MVINMSKTLVCRDTPIFQRDRILRRSNQSTKKTFRECNLNMLLNSSVSVGIIDQYTVNSKLPQHLQIRNQGCFCCQPILQKTPHVKDVDKKDLPEMRYEHAFTFQFVFWNYYLVCTKSKLPQQLEIRKQGCFCYYTVK